jgi:mycobactin lysine-N-oxygenase
MALKHEKFLAIIGGGPKAAAIACKAEVMNTLGRSNLTVVIFEQKSIGANWDGSRGYTNGRQILCTPVERDLGFPYSSMLGKEVDLIMQKKYSWAAYQVAHGEDYSEWVDRGRLPASHSDLAKYLRWALSQAESAIEYRTVTKLTRVGKKWRLFSKDASGKEAAYPTEFNGVVVTGPGPARRTNWSTGLTNIYDGTDFWKSPEKILRLLLKQKRPARQIIILGGGGTGASIAAWLVKHGAQDERIMLVADQATLFGRVDSVFENRMFSDDSLWKSLAPHNREIFSNRLNRGVVWKAVLEDLRAATEIMFVDGRAISVGPGPIGMTVTVKRYNGSMTSLEAPIVIDATGFNAWWFAHILPAGTRVKGASRKRKKSLENAVGQDLSFHGKQWPFPPLHVPMLASKIGPGHGSLMALGGMSDAILRRY